MRIPELPLEPVENSRLIIGATDEAPEDEDRIHELVKIADRKTKPEWVGPSAELMPGGEVLDWCCQCGCEIRSANDGHYDADLCEWTCDGCYYELYDSGEYDDE